MNPISKFAVGIVALATVATLGACTGVNTPVSSSTSTSTSASTTGSSSVSLPSDETVFGAQSKVLLDQNPTASVVQTSTGDGDKTFTIPALPEGKTRIGLVINCSSGDWKVHIDQVTPASSGALCSLDITPSADFPVDNPEKENKLSINAQSSAKYWITIFYK